MIEETKGVQSESEVEFTRNVLAFHVVEQEGEIVDHQFLVILVDHKHWLVEALQEELKMKDKVLGDIA